MGYSARTVKAMQLRKSRPFQQFGQSDDESTINGATGCTHTMLQFLALLWKGKWYTHDQISRMVGYHAGSNRRGMYPSEVTAFCNKVGLPYVVKFGLSAGEVIDRAKMAPVMFGHAYSWWPEWKGYRYKGLVADGKPNGYALPSGEAGKTQLSGFTGAHAGLLIGTGSTSSGSPRAIAWEPNHGSSARPEKPPYDAMTPTQFRAVYDSYKLKLGRTAYALVPTKNLPL